MWQEEKELNFRLDVSLIPVAAHDMTPTKKNFKLLFKLQNRNICNAIFSERKLDLVLAA